MNKKVLIFIGLLLSSIHILAQKSCVLWDKEYNMPISKASIYTTDKGKVNCSSSDEQGKITVGFSFDKLTISHINYKKLIVNSLPDTLFLEPESWSLPEIIVSGGEPHWIRPMIKRFVKVKNNLYGYQGVMNYSYQVQNTGDSTLYKFESKGLIRKGNLFEIFPLQSIITYKDKTAGCDYNNLKNSIYHDFVTDMDNDFIKHHKFYIDDQCNDNNKNVVRILFKSQKVPKDSGCICIDTADCAILSAVRYTGLEYNVKNRTNPLILASINALYGHKYKDWQIDYEVNYKKKGDIYYLSDCKYSNYIVEEFGRKKIRGTRFYHVMSTYCAEPYTGKLMNENNFISLPKPFAVKIIMTKKETNMEKSLQNVRKEYNVY